LYVLFSFNIISFCFLNDEHTLYRRDVIFSCRQYMKMKCTVTQTYVNIPTVAPHYGVNLKGKNHGQNILIVRPIKKLTC